MQKAFTAPLALDGEEFDIATEPISGSPAVTSWFLAFKLVLTAVSHFLCWAWLQCWILLSRCRDETHYPVVADGWNTDAHLEQQLLLVVTLYQMLRDQAEF